MYKNQPARVPYQFKSYKSLSRVLLLFLNLYFSSFYFGYCIGYLGNFDFKVIKHLFKLDNFSYIYEFILTEAIPIGAASGALFSSILLKFPRRNTLLIVNIVAIISCGLILIYSQTFFIISRFVQGFCVGIYSVLIPIMIREFAPTEIYGTLGCLFQFSIVAGVFTSYLISFLSLDSDYENTNGNQRIVFGFPIIIKIIQTLLLLFVCNFQTPIFLLSKNKDNECRKVLKKLYKQEYMEAVYRQKYRQVYPVKEPLLNESQVAQITHKIKFRRKRIIIAIYLAFILQFSGINYGFDNTKIPRYKLAISGFIVSILSLFSVLMFSKIQRKFILQLGTCCFAYYFLIFFLVKIKILTDGIIAEILSQFALQAFLFAICLCLGPFFWIYLPEIVPSQFIPISTFAYWASYNFNYYPSTCRNLFKVYFTCFSFMVCCFILHKQKICPRNKRKKPIADIY